MVTRRGGETDQQNVIMHKVYWMTFGRCHTTSIYFSFNSQSYYYFKTKILNATILSEITAQVITPQNF